MPKQTWQVIKKVVGKENCNELKFPLKKVADETNITNIHSIAEIFNKYFTKIETYLTVLLKRLIHQINIFMNTLKNTKCLYQKILFL